MREGFVFFRSYLSVLLLVEEKHRAELLEAICAYALDGVLLPLSGKSEVAMSAIKPLIDMNERHHARTKKRASEEGECVQNRRKTLPPLVTPQEKEIEIEKEIKKEKEKESPDRTSGLDPRAAMDFYYQRKREEAERAAMRNRQRAELVVGYKEAERALRDWYIASAKREVRGEQVDAAEEERLQALVRGYLAKAGLTEEDLRPHYACARCEDTGFLPDGHLCNCYPRSQTG